MSDDQWSPPTFKDLKVVLESIGKSDSNHNQSAERLELSVPARVLALRKAIVSVITCEIAGSA